MDLSKIKYTVQSHKKIVVLIVVVLILVIIGSCVRFTVINTPNEEDQPEPGSVESITLTSEQQKLYDNYSNDTWDLIDIFKTNKWVDDSGNNNLNWNEKQFTERSSENEETQTYAICNIDKEEDKTTPYLHYNYDITMLFSDGKYSHCQFTIRYKGQSTESGYDTMYFEGNNFFKKAKLYTLVVQSNNLTINCWEQNAEQFLDGNYQQMYNEIKNYLALYYPQVDTVTWEKNVIIDYNGNKISYIFNLKTRNTQRIMVTYSKDDKTFTIKKTTVVIEQKY